MEAEEGLPVCFASTRRARDLQLAVGSCKLDDYVAVREWANMFVVKLNEELLIGKYHDKRGNWLDILAIE